MTQTTDAALVPEDVRALRVQNGALRTLNHCLEQEIRQHRAKAQEYHAATTTLDSEREANRILTDTIEAQARRIEALEAALAPFSAPPLYVYDGLPSNRFVPANQPEDWIGGGWFTAGEFDTARALLEKAPTP